MKVNITPSSFNAQQDTWAARIAQASKQTERHVLTVDVNSAQALQEQAKQLASTIVHKKADEVPDVTYARLKITTSNERAADMKAIMTIGKEMTQEYASLRGAWNDFRQSLTQTAMDLAGKDFGFTVDKNGGLIATDAGDTLDAGQKDRLSQLMNELSGLKSSANRYAQLAIDSTNAWGISKSNIFHVRHLDMENFHSTLDLGLMINKEKSGELGALSKYTWEGQMIDKGEPASAYREWTIS
ncbi:MAG: hypothetical protein ACOH2K_00085 [Burkholderiaceae bacterium]